MTVEVALIIMGICAVVTGLVTECIKKLVNGDVKANLVALITGLVVGLASTFIYYGSVGIPFSVMNIIYGIVLSLASAMGAMLGYDKIIQAIEQLFRGKSDDEG